MEKLSRPLRDQIRESEQLSNIHIAKLTPEQVAESRQRLQASVPRPSVAPPHVPERFEHVRFEDTELRTDVDGFDAALEAVHEWIRRVVEGDPGRLALIGPKGVSKSHLAYCAAWELYEEHGIHVPCYPWYDMVDWLRSGRYDETPTGIREVPPALIRHRWHETKVCIVDEARPTSGTDFDAMELTKFSLNRYDRKRGVLLTCNWSSLGALIGEPAADRYTCITMVGPSYRER